MASEIAGGRKPLSRVARKRLQAKREILEAALAILLDQGLDGLTLAAVSDRLGFTKPALYHYFRSKEDLFHSLILELLQQEMRVLVEAVLADVGRDAVLGVLIRAFYRHYRPRLNAFRLIYCQFQLMNVRALGFDQDTIREDLNPLSQGLFELVADILSDHGRITPTPQMRRLAFSAWLAAVGLVEMIGISDASQDPLLHGDEQLLATMETVFNAAAVRLGEPSA